MPTSGLVLGVDIKTMTVTNQRTLIDPKQNPNADTQGSLQALSGNASGNMLVGYGSWATVKEFNAKNEVIWTARFGPDAQIASYRGFKFDWHAIPAHPPSMKVVAYLSPTMHRSTHVYVSWNGATDLARWNFFAQASHGAEPVLIGSIPKSEFETSLIIEGVLDRVSVQPALVNGTTLPRSPVRRTERHGDWTGANGTLAMPDDPLNVVPIIVDPESVAAVKENGDENSQGTPQGSVLQDGHEGEAAVGITYSDTDAEYDAPIWAEAAPFFFIVCLAGAVVLLYMSLSRRRKQARYDRIPGVGDL